MPTIRAQIRTLSLTGTAVLGLSGQASAQTADYQYSFQMPDGQSATFHVSGSATGDSPDVQGDSLLNRVVMPNGMRFIRFFKPIDVSNLTFSGPVDKFSVQAGTNCTVGLSNVDMDIEDFDGNGGDVTQVDRDMFADLALKAMQTNNLNNYVDVSGNLVNFSFIIQADRVVKDNDANPGDFGELLYFERGAGAGNSWLKVQAVDEFGAALGPRLVLCPSETVQTTPVTVIKSSTQKMWAPRPSTSVAWASPSSSTSACRTTSRANLPTPAAATWLPTSSSWS